MAKCNAGRWCVIGLAIVVLSFANCGEPESVEKRVPPEPVAAALQLQLNGEFYAARSEWKNIVEEHPDYHDGWYNMGVCDDNMGRFTLATHEYEKALKLDGANPYYKFSYAVLLLSSRQYERFARARKLLLESTEANPYYIPGWYNLAVVEQMLNKPDEGLVAIDRCLEVAGHGSSETDPLRTPHASLMYQLRVDLLLDLRDRYEEGSSNYMKWDREATRAAVWMKEHSLPIEKMVAIRLSPQSVGS